MNYILYRVLLGCLAVIMGVFAGIVAYTVVEAILAYALGSLILGSDAGFWILILARGLAGGSGYFFTAMYVSPSRSRRPIEAYTIVGLVIWLVGMSGYVESQDWAEAWSFLVAALACGILGVRAGIRHKRKEESPSP